MKNPSDHKKPGWALVSVEAVLKLSNPLLSYPWPHDDPEIEPDLKKIDFNTVRAVSSPKLHATDHAYGKVPSLRYHAGRIKHLMKHGWDDAIEIDVGIPSLGYGGPLWPVTDGNHRLAAAAIRGDKFIMVEVAGCIDTAAELLQVPAEDLLGEPAEK